MTTEADAAENLTPERWLQIKGIFQAAVELDAFERHAFLEQACSGDEELRLRVESLLSSDEQEWELLEKPAFDAAAALLADEPPALSVGQCLGHYTILDLLGAGGMGEVYLAEDEILHRKVALKLLPAEMLSGEDRLRRFKQEARAASALNHPNIITIYEIGESDGRHFIASEFIAGQTLRQRLRGAAPDITETLKITIQVANALLVAHEAGIIHRDIKPENIMLRPDGYVKVLDFGLATPTDSRIESDAVSDGARRAIDITAPGSAGLVAGTVKYMSPEQAMGQRVDTRSDIFSLGVVIYEMLTGRAPFQGETSTELIASIRNDEAHLLREHSPDSPVEMQAVVGRALAKNRDERYQTIKELLADLTSLNLESHLVYGTRAIVGEPSFETAAPSAAPIPAILRIADLIQRHKTTSALILLVIIAVGGGAFYAVSKLGAKQQTRFQKIRIARVNGTGDVRGGAISRDGRYLAYVKNEQGQSSLWIREIATNTDARIVSPADAVYRGITFSNEGDYVFYVNGANENSGALYQAPRLGGDPRKLLDDVGGLVTLSPDGARLAFVRVEEKATSIIVANTDGSGQWQLARRTWPEVFNPIGPAWSPDGRVIACPVSRMAGERYANVVELLLAGGGERPVSAQKWASVEQLAWLSDGTGLMMVATESLQGSPYQIWSLAYPSGESRKVTSDLSSYARLSLTADSKTLATVRVAGRSSIWYAPNGEAKLARQITDEGDIVFRELCWTPDGRIVAPSEESGNREIWIMNADGTDRKQLTRDGSRKASPSVTADGRYIVFVSGLSDVSHIWRINIDGGNPTELTTTNNDQSPSCSPDGWVIYESGSRDDRTLWKVPLDGGRPVQVIESPSGFPSVSPDGTMIACRYKDVTASKWGLAVIPIGGGHPLRTLELLPGTMMCWSADSRALTYVVTRSGVSNVWSQPLDGSPPTRATDFDSFTIYGFDWSRDGALVCSRGFGVRDLVLISDFD